MENPLVLKDGHYEIDFEDLEKKIAEEHIKLMFLCSPHNPVGRVWTKEELEKIGKIIWKYQVILVSDENVQDIAETLMISRAALYRHIASLNEKTGTKSRIGLVQFYYRYHRRNEG